MDSKFSDFQRLRAAGAWLLNGDRGVGEPIVAVDPGREAEMLRQHGLLAALHAETSAATRAAWMQPLHAAAEQAHRQILRSNLAVVGQLGWLFERLRLARVEFILLKGPVLAEIVWGHLGIRAFGDVDLLVSEGAIEAAAAVLKAEGFEEGELPLAYERVFLHRARSLKVELHSRLVSQGFLPRFETRYAWPPVEVTLAGIGRVPTLREEYHFIFAAVHAAKHLLEFFFPPSPIVRLGLYVEIARWAGRRELDWDRILADCDEMGCRRAMLHAPACARAWFGWTPPPRLAQALDEEPGLGRLVEHITAGVGIGHQELKQSPRQLWRQARVAAGLRDSRVEGVKFALRYFTPPLVRRLRGAIGLSE